MDDTSIWNCMAKGAPTRDRDPSPFSIVGLSRPVGTTAQRRGPPAGGSGWPKEGTLTCQSGGSLAGEALSRHSDEPWLRERLGREKGNSPRAVPSLRGRGSREGPLGEKAPSLPSGPDDRFAFDRVKSFKSTSRANSRRHRVDHRNLLESKQLRDQFVMPADSVKKVYFAKPLQPL